MEFFNKVMSVNSRMKSERAREAALVNQTFQENIENVRRFFASEEHDEVLALLDMVYDSSFPEEQVFMKTPSRERLNSRKELVVRLLIGLDSLGVPVMSELLAFMKKHGPEGVADTLMVLLEIISPLLEGKEAPEFSTDDFVEAIDSGWHSTSLTGSPLLNVLASAASSPRASTASVGDVSPRHPLGAGSPYRRALSDRSMFVSRSHELGSKSVLDKPRNTASTPPLASQSMPASIQNPSVRQEFVDRSSRMTIMEEPPPEIPHASTDKKPSVYGPDTSPEPGNKQRLHRRKSSSLRELFAEDEADKLAPPDDSVGTSSKRSSMRRTSSELSKLTESTAMETSSPTNSGLPARRAGSLKTEDKRFLLNDDNQDRKLNGSGRKSSWQTSVPHLPDDQLAISAGEDAGGFSLGDATDEECATQNSGIPIKQFSQGHEESEVVDSERMEDGVSTTQRDLSEDKGNERDRAGAQSTSGREHEIKVEHMDGDKAGYGDGEHVVQVQDKVNPASLPGKEHISGVLVHGRADQPAQEENAYPASREADDERNVSASSPIETLERPTSSSTLPLQGHTGPIPNDSYGDELMKHNDTSDGGDFLSNSTNHGNQRKSSDLTTTRALLEQEKLDMPRSGSEIDGQMQTKDMAYVKDENYKSRQEAGEEVREKFSASSSSASSSSSSSSSSSGSKEDQSTASSGSDADKGLPEVINGDDEASRPYKHGSESQIPNPDPLSTSHTDDVGGHAAFVPDVKSSAGNQAEAYPSKDCSHEEEGDGHSYPEEEAFVVRDACTPDIDIEGVGSDTQVTNFEQEACESMPDSKGSKEEGYGYGSNRILAPLLVDQVITPSSQDPDEETGHEPTALAQDAGDAHSLQKEARDTGHVDALEDTARYAPADDLEKKGCEPTTSDKVITGDSSEGLSGVQGILAPLLVLSPMNATHIDGDDGASDMSASEQGLNCKEGLGSNGKQADELHGATLPALEGDGESKNGPALMKETLKEEDTNRGPNLVGGKQDSSVDARLNTGLTSDENPQPEMPALNSRDDGTHHEAHEAGTQDGSAAALAPPYPPENDHIKDSGESKDAFSDQGSEFIRRPSDEASDDIIAEANCHSHLLPDSDMPSGHSSPPHIPDAATLAEDHQSMKAEDNENGHHRLREIPRDCGTECELRPVPPPADAREIGAALHDDGDHNSSQPSKSSTSSNTDGSQGHAVNQSADHTPDMDTDVSRSKRKGKRVGKLAQGFLACCAKPQTSHS